MQDRTGLRARRNHFVFGLCLLAGAALWTPRSSAQEVSFKWDASSAHARAAASGYDALSRPAAAHYDVIALRVEFQPDTTRFTTGDGTFGGVLYEGGLEPSIDPFPHDDAYFNAHLSFLENYVSRISNGRTGLTTHLVPEVVRVSGKMGDYSPTGQDSGSDEELRKLAALIPEAWSAADALGSFDASGFDPETTAFLIFHAGVGRDIELLGTTLDKTPQDLPSIYLDGEALGRLSPAQNADFAGLPVTHGLLVPRTQSRRAIDPFTDEPFLAEFSMNGMLAASFFNFLGVPDLFDTETGESAIGPFGLMDGLGIFAMSGLFPPEPSAWTRVYLGWEDVTEVRGADTDLTLPHAGDTGGGSVARVWISPAEYFLVENRSRDPENDGVRMQVWSDGIVQEVQFPGGDETFNPVSVSGFPGGVVVDVDTYDFALPGGVDEDDNPLIGGALIWHVDERRLKAGLATNGVNTDREARSIDLEEADSAQDIGYTSGGFFGPQFELGSPFDFWYEANPVTVVTASGQDVRLYQNRFGSDTQPASTANDGGASFVELLDFSLPQSTMTARVMFTSVAGLSREMSAALPGPTAWSEPYPIWMSDDQVAVFGPESSGAASLALVGPEGTQSIGVDFLSARPAWDGSRLYAVRSDGVAMYDGLGQLLETIPIPTGALREAFTPMAVSSSGEVYVAGTGDRGPVLISYSGSGLSVEELDEDVSGLMLVDGAPALVLSSEVVIGDRRWPFDTFMSHRAFPYGGFDRLGQLIAFTDPDAGKLYLLQEQGYVLALSAEDYNPELSSWTSELTVADVDEDGLLDVVVGIGQAVWAFNRGGAVVDGFPIRFDSYPTGRPIPVVRAGEAAIMTALVNGSVDLQLIEGPGRSVPGFPLPAGEGATSGMRIRADRVAFAPADGVLGVWQVDGLATLHPEEERATGARFVSVSSIGPEEPGRALLNAEETYNWPNPVRIGSTRFRFEVSETADVDIRILDMTGREMDRLSESAVQPNVPSELIWDAVVPNGIYYARVRAKSTSGATQDQLVKVAVLR